MRTLAIFVGCQAGWDHCTKDVLGRKGGSWQLVKSWKDCTYWKGVVGRTVASLQLDEIESNSRARSGLGEPQPWYGCPSPDKGRDISSGRQSVYYLIIPSVVPEIPLWFLYSQVDVGGGRKGRVVKGGINNFLKEL